MMYKIVFHQTGGRITITKESNVARPISAYLQGQIEPNTVYAVVTKTKQEDSGDRLEIRMLDMCVRINGRFIFPCLDIENANPEGVLVGKIKIYTNCGKLNVGNDVADAATSIYKKIWTRSTSKLLEVIKAVQNEYCKQTFVNHIPWLTTMNNRDVYKMILRELSDNMGRRDTKK